MEFSNLGSGGKKTVFKASCALAIHRLAAKKKIALPSFLIIDTPMKNISERENFEIFKGFYGLVYQLMSDDLKDTQVIIIDKEYYAPGNEFEGLKIIHRHMAPCEGPLIPYYKGY